QERADRKHDGGDRSHRRNVSRDRWRTKAPPEYNARMPTPGRTEANLHVALAGEADANRRYLAYGIQAMAEGRADIAQLFLESAGAETIHALMHLKTMGAIGTTRENLMTAATGEIQEIDVVLPRMIREADEDGRP